MIAQTVINWQPIAGYVLTVIGVIVGGVAVLRKLEWNQDPDELTQVRNSDAPAPDGFAEHVQLIADTAYLASPETREAYYLAGYSEADVLRAEYLRLSKVAP